MRKPSKALQQQWHYFGRVFGYPECCIESFKNLDHKKGKSLGADGWNKAWDKGPWVGTGFVPCKKHLREANKNFKAFVKKYITPIRIHWEDFPKDEEAI